MPRLALGLLTLILCGPASAPAKGEHSAGPNTIFDLSDRFVIDSDALKAGVATPESYSKHYPVLRRGRRLDCMVLVAPLSIRASLGGLRGRMTLECLATPVFNVGDGFLLEVFVSSAGTERPVFSRYFDSGRRAEDRDWIPLSIPLEFDSSGDARLHLRLSAGPQGDLVDDWLALSAVRLKSEGASK